MRKNKNKQLVNHPSPAFSVLRAQIPSAMPNIIKSLLTLSIFAAASLIFYYIFVVIHSTYMRQNERLSTSVERIIASSLEDNTKQIIEFLSLNMRLTQQNPRVVLEKAMHYEMLKVLEEALADLKAGRLAQQTLSILHTLKNPKIDEQLQVLEGDKGALQLATDKEIYTQLSANFGVRVEVLNKMNKQGDLPPPAKKLSFKEKLRGMISIEPLDKVNNVTGKTSAIDLLALLLERQEYELLYSLLTNTFQVDFFFGAADKLQTEGAPGLQALAHKARLQRHLLILKEIIENASMIQND